MRHNLFWVFHPIAALFAVCPPPCRADPLIAYAADLPNHALTPGAIASTAPVCSGTWSRQRDNDVLWRYGIAPGPHPDFEVDHLVPLCLGGSDFDANLWPEPRRSIEPSWDAEKKDRLEAFVCSVACRDPAQTARLQREIAADWIALYLEMFP